MLNSVNMNKNFGVIFNPFANPIMQGNKGFDTLFPALGQPDFSNAFNDDFMSMLLMYNAFLTNPMAFSFPKDFNTNTNLPQLKDVYNPKLSGALANIAYEHASNKDTRHKCLQGVRESLTKNGLVKGSMGGSAYQSAEVLAANKNFKEVHVDRNDLRKLPAGCVVVWNKKYIGSKSSDVHGHIAITTGDGGEASDHVSSRLYMLKAQHRVFVPVGGLSRSA